MPLCANQCLTKKLFKIKEGTIVRCLSDISQKKKMSTNIAIDFGSDKTRLFLQDSGVVLDEPSLVAVEVSTNRVVAYGDDAYAMFEKTSDKIKIIKVIQRGVVTDFDAALMMLKHFIRKSVKKHPSSLRVILNMPEEITDLEQYNLISLLRFVGIKKIYLIDTCKAALLGAGYDIMLPKGRFVVDIGADNTKFGVLTLGDNSEIKRLSSSGRSIEDAIKKYMKKKYNLLIGNRTAENAKKALCCAREPSDLAFFKVKGRSLATGMPAAVEISNFELLSISESFSAEMAIMIQSCMNGLSPEIVSDICKEGVVITGGGANIIELDKYIETRINISIVHPENSEHCVINGCAKAMDYLSGDLKASPLREAELN